MQWNLSNSQKEQFLNLLSQLGSKNVYPLKFIQEKLSGCGVPVKINEIDDELLIGSDRIKVITPEWGEPGIYPLHILAAAVGGYGLSGEISSKMTGRGFYFNDCLQQLAIKWGIKKSVISLNTSIPLSS